MTLVYLCSGWFLKFYIAILYHNYAFSRSKKMAYKCSLFLKAVRISYSLRRWSVVVLFFVKPDREISMTFFIWFLNRNNGGCFSRIERINKNNIKKIQNPKFSAKMDFKSKNIRIVGFKIQNPLKNCI